MDLKLFRLKCEQRNIPIISQETENFLEEILQKLKPKVCVEIGGAVWYSSIFVAGIVNKRGGKVYTFEISYPAYLEWLANISKSGLYNITSYPFDFVKADIKKLVPTNVDFLFVDGQKNQYADYLEKSENIIGKDTFIVIDDVIKYHNKLTKLYWYLEKKQINYKLDRTGTNTGDARVMPKALETSKARRYEIKEMEEGDWIMIIE